MPARIAAGTSIATGPGRVADELLQPSYWLVHGLPWQGDGSMAEAALAIAPAMIDCDSLSRDAFQILWLRRPLRRQTRTVRRVLLRPDPQFTTAGTSWAQLSVDWESALQELQDGPFPALLVTISQRAHIFICNAATRLLLYGPDGEEEATDAERQLVRQVIASMLTADWPPYLQQMINTGRIRLVG